MMKPTLVGISQGKRQMKAMRQISSLIASSHQIIRDQNHFINAFSHVQNWKDSEDPGVKGRLAGKPIAIKANIATKDLPTTCASKMLENYTSPFDATAVKALRREGGYIIGKTNMDEFGMGSSNVHSFHGPVINPLYTDHQRVAGGSSGGSAAAVAMGACFAALGSDTGGSVRLPAAFCGVVGFKPSYGAISRYGLVSYASSLDTIGILAKSVDDVRDVFDVIRGKDQFDMTSWDLGQAENQPERLRIGVPQEYNLDGISEDVLQAWSDALTFLESRGAEIVPVSLPHTEHALPAYYVIAPAEASSNLARYDGIRYGFTDPDSDFTRLRTLGFGPEVRKRIMLGTYVLQANEYNSYFQQAQKIRRCVKEDFQRGFDQSKGEGVHALITPVSPYSVPPRLNEPVSARDKDYVNDMMTIPASLAGVPALVMPFGKKRIGLQLIGAFGKDLELLRLGNVFS